MLSPSACCKLSVTLVLDLPWNKNTSLSDQVIISVVFNHLILPSVVLGLNSPHDNMLDVQNALI